MSEDLDKKAIRIFETIITKCQERMVLCEGGAFNH